jgi:hypothetical protein
MLYCPNCSAYLYDPGSETCDKCGYDLSSYTEQVPEPDLDVPGRKKVPDVSFSVRKPCKRCGAPTKDIRGEIEINVEGTRMSIYGLKLMGGEITKVPLTQYTYSIDGYECKEGHKFFNEFKCRIRPLCPVCYDPMMKYGSSLLSCSRCNKHFPVENWVEPDKLNVLLDHGWAPIPD